jgi:hypothetical protein
MTTTDPRVCARERCFLLAMLPYLVLAGYYAYAGAWVAASAWFLGTLLMMACVAVWVIASMPDNMQENQGGYMSVGRRRWRAPSIDARPAKRMRPARARVGGWAGLWGERWV